MARPRSGAGKGARERIVEAYGKLAMQKPLDGITVLDVCQEAGCNRTTLYYHFETFDQVKQSFLSALFQSPPESCIDVLLGKAPGAAQLASFDTLCTMLALNLAGDFRNHIHGIVVQRARMIFAGTGIEGVQLDLKSEFVASGTLAVMAQRGKKGNCIDPSELTRTLLCMLS